MDNVDSHFDELWSRVLNDSLSVFIGAENPIKEINEFTLITGKYQLPEGRSGLPAGRQGFVSIIGPRRMNYKRNMSLVKYISEHINNINA
jgi:transcriptional regulator of heat shock response